MEKSVIFGIIFGIIVLFLLWNYKELSRLLRQAILPIMRDRGVIVIVQLVITYLTFILVQQPILNHQAFNNIMWIKFFCLFLAGMVTYSAILYRLASLNSNKYLTIDICFLQGLKILPKVLWLCLLVSLCVFGLVALILMILWGIVWLICHYKEVSFSYEQTMSFLPVFMIIYTAIIMSVSLLCTYYAYFAAILVIIEKTPVLKALKQSYKMVKKIPTRSVIITIVIIIVMLLLSLLLNALFGKYLLAMIFNSLGSILLISVSLVIYYEYKYLLDKPAV